MTRKQQNRVRTNKTCTRVDGVMGVIWMGRGMRGNGGEKEEVKCVNPDPVVGCGEQGFDQVGLER